MSFARALAICWFVRSMAASLFAFPFAVAIQVHLQHHPQAEAVLFEAGGAWLLVSLRAAAGLLRGLADWSWLVWVAASICWLPALGLLIACCDRSEPRGSLALAMRRVGRCFGSLVLVFGLTLLAQSVAVALGVGLSHYGLAPALPPAAAGLVRAGGWLVGLWLAWSLAVVQDMLRVQLICHRLDLYSACEKVWDTVGLCGLYIGWQAGWRSLASLLLFAGGMYLSLHAEQGLLAVVLVGQGTSLSALYLRATFFRLERLHRAV